MILFPLMALWIWLQVFAASTLAGWHPKDEQSRPEDGNSVQ
jgi:hypothetical protein